jgi:hypothetical protein
MVNWRSLSVIYIGLFSADYVHEVSLSNLMQMTGQIECKWVGSPYSYVDKLAHDVPPRCAGSGFANSPARAARRGSLRHV